MEAVFFYILAAITLVSAFLVVLLRRPIQNVLFMIIMMIGLAGLFILLHAEFVAMVQLVVYAGAIMVLFLFVIMLLNIGQFRLPPPEGSHVRWWAGAVIAFAVMGLIWLVFKVTLTPAAPPALEAGQSNTEVVGRALFTTYLLPFEIASVLLLAAIVGSVLLARSKS